MDHLQRLLNHERPAEPAPTRDDASSSPSALTPQLLASVTAAFQMLLPDGQPQSTPGGSAPGPPGPRPPLGAWRAGPPTLPRPPSPLQPSRPPPTTDSPAKPPPPETGPGTPQFQQLQELLGSSVGRMRLEYLLRVADGDVARAVDIHFATTTAPAASSSVQPPSGRDPSGPSPPPPPALPASPPSSTGGGAGWSEVPPAARPRPPPPLLSPEVLYTAVVLDGASHQALLRHFQSQVPEHWRMIADHMTINIGSLATEFRGKLSKRQPVTLHVTHFGISWQAAAVQVTGCPTINAVPHVTLAVAPGCRPFDSNFITSWQPVDEPLAPLTGVVAEVNVVTRRAEGFIRAAASSSATSTPKTLKPALTPNHVPRQSVPTSMPSLHLNASSEVSPGLPRSTDFRPDGNGGRFRNDPYSWAAPQPSLADLHRPLPDHPAVFDCAAIEAQLQAAAARAALAAAPDGGGPRPMAAVAAVVAVVPGSGTGVGGGRPYRYDEDTLRALRCKGLDPREVAQVPHVGKGLIEEELHGPDPTSEAGASAGRTEEPSRAVPPASATPDVLRPCGEADGPTDSARQQPPAPTGDEVPSTAVPPPSDMAPSRPRIKYDEATLRALQPKGRFPFESVVAAAEVYRPWKPKPFKAAGLWHGKGGPGPRETAVDSRGSHPFTWSGQPAATPGRSDGGFDVRRLMDPPRPLEPAMPSPPPAPDHKVEPSRHTEPRPATPPVAEPTDTIPTPVPADPGASTPSVAEADPEVPVQPSPPAVAPVSVAVAVVAAEGPEGAPAVGSVEPTTPEGPGTPELAEDGAGETEGVGGGGAEGAGAGEAGGGAVPEEGPSPFTWSIPSNQAMPPSALYGPRPASPLDPAAAGAGRGRGQPAAAGL